MSDLSRRGFLASAGAGAAGVVATTASAAQPAAGGAAPALKYRLGIVTYNIAANWDVPTILRICRAVGLSPVELRTTHRHGVEPTMNAEARKEVRQRFQDAGIEIWGCGTTCEFHSPNKEEVQRQINTCRDFIRLAADIGGKGVKVRPNALPQGVAVERTLEQIGRSLAECGRIAADHNVEIWLEVHGPGTQEPRNIRTIMEQCKHPRVGITWNSNQTDIVNNSVSEYFRLLRPWIKSCHINELHSGYPYRELFRLLREANYDRVCLAEIQGMPDEATGERLMRYYKALWTELARPAT